MGDTPRNRGNEFVTMRLLKTRLDYNCTYRRESALGTFWIDEC